MIMKQKLRVLFTLLVAVAFLVTTAPVFASSSTKKEDGKKTTTSKSTKSKKKDSEKKTSKKKNTKKSSKVKSDNKVPFKGKMNINKASKEDLMKLPGIGEVKAEKIIKARKKMGKFKTSEDLMEISGIGEQTVKGLAKYLTF
jgi:competence ComEA-like helix-hairpin-helix protein